MTAQNEGLESLEKYINILAARICYGAGVSDPDMVEELAAEAQVALEEAKGMFDESRGMAWRTFAHEHCTHRLVSYIARNRSSLIPMPDNRTRLWDTVRRVREQLSQQLLREPRDAEWAEAAGITVAELHNLRVDYEALEYLSYDEATEDDYEDTEHEWTATALDSGVPSPEVLAIHDEVSQILDLYVQGLTATEAAIVQSMYGLGGEVPLSQAKTAEVVGLSQSRVSELHVRALRKLAARGALELSL